MQPSQVFQITSLEPAQLILPQVTETANRHELAVEIAEAVPFSAPFCGSEYFVQEIRMVAKSDSSSLPRYEECLEEIQAIVEQELADGYVETR